MSQVVDEVFTSHHLKRKYAKMDRLPKEFTAKSSIHQKTARSRLLRMRLFTKIEKRENGSLTID